MTDYRLPENRLTYFNALYKMTLEHRCSPGMVYLYMPALAEMHDWDNEQRLWFAMINGCTQNPLTSMRILEQLPECPMPSDELTSFETWFNEAWPELQFDTDRLKNKRGTVQAIKSYAALAWEAGSQLKLYQGKTYAQAWDIANKIHSFGRLSTFSYLEYCNLNGLGPDCRDLMFDDREGSRSHRNGMLLLLGLDTMVWDKRMVDGHDGKYRNFEGMCGSLRYAADEILIKFRERYPEVPDPGYFTLESVLCAFKNSFFGRRWAGCYADMAWERIQWYDERGYQQLTAPFKDIRAANLPEWLRLECEGKGAPSMRERKEMFKLTGQPFRGEHFLPLPF
jgi:hypothetical protein